MIDAATGSWYKLSANTLHGSLVAAHEPAGQLTREQLVLLNLGISLDRIQTDLLTGRTATRMCQTAAARNRFGM